nr:NADH dehydrogenase subunit 2 [Mansonella ozzardi]
MLFFVFFLLLFLSFVNFCVIDCIVWWSVFIICTFVFIFMAKGVSGFCLINYYIIQEISGYYFLLFDGWMLQFMVLLLKSGSSPFHFWLFSFLPGLNKWYFLWFLFLQKLPYFFVLVNFCGDFFFFILFFGMVVCYLQFFYLRDFGDMVVIGSTESFNWLLLLGMFSFNEVFIFFFFYYFTMMIVMSYTYMWSFNFFSIEMLMIFFNVPMSMTFFLKVFTLFDLSVGFYYYLLLLIMPLLSVGFGYFFFLICMTSFNYGLKYYDYFIYLVFCLGFLSVF